MRKVREKNNAKIWRKKGNYAKKHSLIVMVENMYCGRTDRKDS